MTKYMRSKLYKAFSLVELVIVIVILGIVAAIAVPRISQGARGAGESALRSDLKVLRNAIELYASEHNGSFPGSKSAGGSYGAAGSEAAFKNQLILYTDAEGNCSTVKDATYIYGPYLRKDIPPLPIGKNKGSTLISTANNGPYSAVEDGTGWVYNYETGEIIANADETDDSGTPYEQY